ncbi:MAG: type II secretion system F family protein [Rhodospirillales bacterium]|nr:type II secretion system F family protein [Rhodospirillales bacterium]
MIDQQFIFFVIAFATGTIVLGGAGMIGLFLYNRPKVLKRQRIEDIGSLGGGESGASEKAESRRQRRIREKVKQLEDSGEKKSRIDAIRELILQAGLDVSVSAYFVTSAIVGAAAGLGGLIGGLPLYQAGLALLIGGLWLPKFVLKKMSAGRQKKFTKNFADAIDLIVRGIRSGLPINECFSVVAREFDPPLGEEFRLLVEGQNLGMTIEDLMAKGILRLPTAEYKFFAIVIQIQRQTGGNLAETLANLSSVLRERKKMRDKAQAMASEAKASAGIIGSLPFVVGTLLSIVNPDYIATLFTTETGNMLIAGGLFWMFLGTMAMRSMINFDM